jgi:hypothetical protein
VNNAFPVLAQMVSMNAPLVASTQVPVALLASYSATGALVMPERALGPACVSLSGPP